MKRLLLSVFALLFLAPALIAQSNRSALRIRLSDGDLMKIAVNNRYFEKVGRVLTIGDLHGKRQYLKVYRFRPYADGKGGKAELIFSGTVKLKRGTDYDAIVDVQNRKLKIKERSGPLKPMQPPPFKPQVDKPTSGGEYIPEEQPQVAHRLPDRLLSLKAAMDKEITDAAKLNKAKVYLRQGLSAQDAATISSWFFFDDTRMEFVKAALPEMTDKNNAGLLRETFTEESAKQDLDKLLSGK
jgi:hypothetical protein